MRVVVRGMRVGRGVWTGLRRTTGEEEERQNGESKMRKCGRGRRRDMG
jgi:hypothetical protein